MERPADHPLVTAPKVGVLLVNLGSPDAPDAKSVRAYLKEFLSDRRVVEIPQIVWQPILRGAILTTRPQKSAHAYQQIWTDRGAPLVVITADQAAALQQRLGNSVQVDWAMRYGNPSISSKLQAMKAAGCARILLAPLYPQYSSATTGSVVDAANSSLAQMRWQPALRSLPPYHDHHAYIATLAQSMKASLATLSFVPDTIISSFHSMPERTLKLGDPYHCHCQKTARLLSQAIGKELLVTFQSRLGRAKWLEPATDATLARLGRDGTQKIAVLAPGFSADNLETLEEIAIRGRASFLEAGGKDFAYLPCLNADAPGMDMLETLIRNELAGWI